MGDEDGAGAAAMDAREYKVTIPDGKLAADGGGARADSPEQSISTPSYETQSGFKRLRTTGCGWETEVDGGSEHSGASADEAPGTSQVAAAPEEVLQLQERTKAACSELAEVIIQLRRERCAPGHFTI
jgi:hypothetical protein